MPQVPYNPVPSAAPSTSATPTLQLNKKQAFGENIGAGLERVADGMARMATGADALARGQEKLAAGLGEKERGLERVAAGTREVGRAQLGLAAGQDRFGKALDHAGTEIFGRAILLQNIVNESDARDVNTKYSMRTSEMFAEYGALRGKQASEAFPKFQKDLAEIREQYKGTLKNPMAQKMFDSESQGTMTRTMFAGAQHAKNSIKQFHSDTLKAEVLWNQNAPYKDLSDPNEYAERQSAIVNAVTQLGINDAGLDPVKDKDHAIIKAGVLVGTSTQRRNQILQVARDKPWLGVELVEKHWNDMIPSDRIFVKDYVDGKATVTGASKEARQVILNNQKPDGTFVKTNPEMREELEARLDLAAPGNADAKRIALNELESGIVKAANMRRHDIGELNTQMSSLIQTKGITNRAEFEATPEGAAIAQRMKVLNPGAYNKLDTIVRIEAERINEADNHAEFHRIMGLEPQELLDFNVNETKKLSRDQADKVRAEQKRLQANPSIDPSVKRGMSWIENKRPMEFRQLTTVNGVVDKNKLAEFRGGLSVALDLWKQNNAGKPAGIDEVIDKIFPELKAEQERGIFFGGKAESVYFGQIPTGIETRLQDNFKNRYGRQMTKQELRREYQELMFYDRMFGRGTENKNPDAPTPPNVPVLNYRSPRRGVE